MKPERLLIRLQRDEQAQATVEYILIIAVAVGLFLMVYRQLLKPIVTVILSQLAKSMGSLFGSGDALHHLPFKPPN